MIRENSTTKYPYKPAQRSGKTAGSPKRPRKSATKRRRPLKPGLSLLVLEVLGLSCAAVLATMMALGYSATLFAGSGFFSSLLPFAFGVVSLMLIASALLIAWSRLRNRLFPVALFLPAGLSLSLGLLSLWLVFHDAYTPVFTHFRSLVGGKQQAARTTLAHQVYAAYRRHDTTQLQALMARSADFNADIKDAAAKFDLDPNLLQGVAATESSFLPRNSRDGGHGLFQITAVSKSVMTQAERKLGGERLSVDDARHNAFIAAATLKNYLAEMKGDLFLGLLAYNIGPRNGGLKFIMQQYGATDFVSLQPYLQQLPRDYPIRVLSYALAFRLWDRDGRLLAYQEGDNAAHIQRLGIPGLQNNF